MIRPSSLPALTQCPRFEGGSSEFAEDGTNRHRVLEKLFSGDAAALDSLPEDQRDGMEWAVEQIKLKAPLSDYPIAFETRGVFVTDSFEEIPGHIDAECGPVLFDLKWRERDYSAQMAAYVLIKCATQQWKEIEVILLFAEPRRYHRYKLTPDEARRIVEPIIARAKDPSAAPTPCDYCGWCAKKLSCPALNAMAQTVAAGREDWKLEQYHASAIATPDEMGKALLLAQHLDKWVKAVRHYAKEMWLKQGVQIPGCELKERSGKRQCSDLTGAFNALGLPVDKFLACCDVRWSTNKKTPDRPGLENVYAKANGIPLASAKKELKRKLAQFVTTGNPSQSVAPIKSTETEEGGE